MGLLDDKVVFVTGGARGMGRAISVAFAREGADVLTCDIAAQIETASYPLGTREDLQETKELVESIGRRCVTRIADVRSQRALDEVVADGIEELGAIDVLIANAGIIDWRGYAFWETPERSWEDQIDVCLTGVWHSAKAVAPHMIERGSGSMVFTSSNVGREGAQFFSPYVAAKHGVVGFMKAAALELGAHGIRVNAGLPGTTDTLINDNDLGRDRAGGKPGTTREEYLAAVRNWVALRGCGALPPEATADAMVFLASDRASYLTGVELNVDAGHLALPGFNFAPASWVGDEA
jgi:SDR family mycofactocin-dependent oxidoreductase